MGYKITNIDNSPIGLSTCNISSGYGNRKFYNSKKKKYESGFHNGIDITNGNKIYVVADGIVVSIRNSIKGYTEKYPSGNYVKIDHGNNIYTTYCHMKYNSIKLKKGDSVKCGDELGLMGSTGHATGKHLHFGVNIDGKWINPEIYLCNKNNNVISNNYKIKKGDTLSSIAFKFNVSVTELIKLNNIKNPNIIIAGNILVIPNNNEYVVKKGDTLSSIAKKYNTTWKIIYEKNKDKIGNNPNLIKVGLKLKI